MNSDEKFLGRFDRHSLRINEELCRNLSTKVPLIEEIGNHSLLGEGKRIRPLLFVISCQLCGFQEEDIYHYSAIFEYIHTASLLHDDVLDNAEMRRRKPSVNHVWGNSAAVLGGDFLISKSLGIAVSTHNLEFLELLTKTTARMTEGQILELYHTHNWHINKDEYMEIIMSKTAVLISSACACGAIISGAERWAIDHLGKFGLYMGIAFQLMDDLLDYTSSEIVLGKPAGKDLREGKITLPLIYALADLEKEEIERLRGLFKNGKAKDEDYVKLIAMVRSNGVVDRIRSEAKVYADKAESSLSIFPDSDRKRDLMHLNSYNLRRTF
ncbi:MAG: polyprenyl synthetase family protein [Pseudomonadota bacterium]